jgi:hypothetical protein
VAVADEVLVTDLKQVDRRQHRQPIDGSPDPLPAGTPVLPAQLGERQEILRHLRRLAGCPDDVVDRHNLHATHASGGRCGMRVSVIQRGQRLGMAEASQAVA